MKTETLKQPTKLGTYLALTAGAGFAATAADGATVVTFYGPGARTPATSPATPAGINFGIASFYSTYQVLDAYNSSDSVFARPGAIFTRGTDLPAGPGSTQFGVYYASNVFQYGAQAGSQNFANISFNGDDGVYEAVGQFYFAPPGLGEEVPGLGYLIAIAKNDDGSALSISQGVAAIPEPSALALLGLGSAGLLARRRRKLAA